MHIGTHETPTHVTALNVTHTRHIEGSVVMIIMLITMENEYKNISGKLVK